MNTQLQYDIVRVRVAVRLVRIGCADFRALLTRVTAISAVPVLLARMLGLVFGGVNRAHTSLPGFFWRGSPCSAPFRFPFQKNEFLYLDKETDAVDVLMQLMCVHWPVTPE